MAQDVTQAASAVYSAVAGTGAVTIIPASGDPAVYRDLVGLVITTPNAAAATLTISDGNQNDFVLNYPNAALAPSTPFTFPDAPVAIRQTKTNAAWTLTASVNASGFNVTALFVERN